MKNIQAIAMLSGLGCVYHTVPLIEYPKDRGNPGKTGHCYDTGVRRAQRAAKARKNKRARSKK